MKRKPIIITLLVVFIIAFILLFFLNKEKMMEKMGVPLKHTVSAAVSSDF